MSRGGPPSRVAGVPQGSLAGTPLDCSATSARTGHGRRPGGLHQGKAQPVQ